MSELLNKVRHDYIRYANCWEDADVLLEALEVQPGDRILSIGSAGDNSFSMLVHDPELVVAVDVNVIQLNLIALKKAAFTTLDHDAFLQFLGFQNCENRWDLFLQVKESLTDELIDFWTERRSEIEEGVIYAGKFEKYFSAFSKRILPLIHTEDRVKRLFEKKEADSQADFFHKTWNNRRWKWLFKIFFSKFVMGRFGRDPKFLKEVKVPVSTFILNKAQKHLSSVNCQENYFLQFILTGKFNANLPHYARKENFEKIKSRIDRIVTYEGLVEAAFKSYHDMNKFNLSNIFEYMNPQLFTSVSENLAENGQTGARFVYWNLMVPRQMSKIIPTMSDDNKKASQLSEQDKGFFYGNLVIDVKL